MTQEDKELLLKDLCARLPYGVMLHIEESKPLNDYEHITEGIVGGYIYNKLQDYSLEDIYEALDTDCNIQMYLRPMSSMTEDENKEAKENECIIYWDTSPEDKGLLVFASSKGFDWLNKKMFDYRGFIEKGLALEAPEEMY